MSREILKFGNLIETQRRMHSAKPLIPQCPYTLNASFPKFSASLVLFKIQHSGQKGWRGLDLL